MKVNQSVLALLLAGVSAVKLPAQTLQTLCSFVGTNGSYPAAALTLGNDGNFYGSTVAGGITNTPYNSIYTEGTGTIFRVTTNGALTTLVFFNSTNGAQPCAALTLGADGNFYGTTSSGGNLNLNSGTGYGTVFKVTINGTLTPLVYFNGVNGAYPDGALTLGSDGNFYGTTSGGSIDWGTVFKVTTHGMLTTLVSFARTNGAYPYASLTLGTDGNFYGTTFYGGSHGGYDGYGTVFKVTTNGSLTTLVSFNNTNGAHPFTALTLGSDGNFYGSTSVGGITNSIYPNGMGTVFKVTTNGTLTTLLSFTGTNGAYPRAMLTLSAEGNFYGSTWVGGITNSTRTNGYGTVFKVTTNGTLTTLIYFNNTNGAYPGAGLTLGADGNFYGTSGNIANYVLTRTSGMGTVFRLLIPPVVPPTMTLQLLAGYPVLTLKGMLNNDFVVQYSTNLTDTNWINLLSLTNLSSSPYLFLDPAGADQPSRFYRAYMH